MKLDQATRKAVEALAAAGNVAIPPARRGRATGTPGPLSAALAAAPSAWELAPAKGHGGARFAVVLDDFRPVLLNELLSVHWGRRAKRKRGDAEVVAMACHAAGVTRAIGRRRVSVTLVVPKGGRRPDGDAPLKSLWDALAARHGCGALKDDGPAWAEFAPLAYVGGEAWGVRLIIEDIQPEAKGRKGGKP